MKHQYSRGYDHAVRGHEANPPEPCSLFDDDRNKKERDDYLAGYSDGEESIYEFGYIN